MLKFKSLDHFKEKNKINDSNGIRIATIIESLYNNYLNIDTENNEYDLCEKLLSECNKINPSLIPYSQLTNIIFVNKPMYQYEENDSSFPESLQAKMEHYIYSAYGTSVISNPETNNEVFSDELNLYQEISIHEDKVDGILVFYKIIQHIELAISQKESLFEQQIHTINELEYRISETSQKYNNMVSNFISILGIFAAIMMATFGSIQGFTSLFTNESEYSLTEIFLISSLGLFGLLSIIFLLFYSIAKLTGREIADQPYYMTKFTNRYPIYSHAIIISGILFTFSLTHHIKINKPSYLPEFLINNLWLITITLIILIYGLYYIYNLINRFNGKLHIDKYTANFIIFLKNKVGVGTLVVLILVFTLVLISALITTFYFLNI